jgi:hypothetical protein
LGIAEENKRKTSAKKRRALEKTLKFLMGDSFDQNLHFYPAGRDGV